MKKTISILLTLMLMVTSVLPLSVSADEVQPDEKESVSEMTQEDILEIAQAAFPEVYATSQVTADSCDTITELGEVIASGTKALSDTESISYYTYTTGLTSYLYNVNFYQNSSSSGSGYTTTSTDIIMTVNGLVGTMYVKNLKYTIYTNAYDKIIDCGKDGGSTNYLAILGVLYSETASSKAQVLYSTYFANDVLGNNVNVTLKIMIGGNTRSYQVY